MTTIRAARDVRQWDRIVVAGTLWEVVTLPRQLDTRVQLELHSLTGLGGRWLFLPWHEAVDVIEDERDGGNW